MAIYGTAIESVNKSRIGIIACDHHILSNTMLRCLKIGVNCVGQRCLSRHLSPIARAKHRENTRLS